MKRGMNAIGRDRDSKYRGCECVSVRVYVVSVWGHEITSNQIVDPLLQASISQTPSCITHKLSGLVGPTFPSRSVGLSCSTCAKVPSDWAASMMRRQRFLNPFEAER